MKQGYFEFAQSFIETLQESGDEKEKQKTIDFIIKGMIEALDSKEIKIENILDDLLKNISDQKLETYFKQYYKQK